MPKGVAVPAEALATLHRRLAALPARHPERTALMASTGQLYAVSRATLYRLLRGDHRPRDAHREDRGRPRSMPAPEIERWCEIVAAMKLRTTNKKGRHLSTVRTLQLLVGEDGVVMVGADLNAKAAKVPVRPFHDPDPFRELGFANPIAARRAIADEVRLPLGKLSDDDRAFIDALLARTLARPKILAAVRERFPLGQQSMVYRLKIDV